MRSERWYWLYIFCVASLLIHGVVVYSSRNLGEQNVGSDTGGIEVNMVPSPDPTPEAKPDPKPTPLPEKKAEPKPDPKPEPKAVAKTEPVVKNVSKRSPIPLLIPKRAPAVKPLEIKTESPIAKNAVPLPANETVVTPKIVPKIVPEPKPAVKIPVLPEYIQAETPRNDLRVAQKTAPSATRLRVNREALSVNSGGGSETSVSHTKDRTETTSPAAAKEDVVYNGGGKGGDSLPIATPKIGGGGGNSILSVRNEANPLGDTVPDEKPGAGSGSSGGRGNGAGGGLGSSRGKGVGITDSGSSVIGSIRRRNGAGVGDSIASSEGVGTRAPRGSRNSGEEQPGTGGTGQGYGRGKGVQIGDGYEDIPQTAKVRGIPFGEFAGLLEANVKSGDEKGRGGIGRGAVFDPKASGGVEGEIHVVYCLDISGSMRDGNKIGQAQTAIKRALSELRTTDGFNIVLFKIHAIAFAPDMQRVSSESVSKAKEFIDNLSIGDGTNLSEAMDKALSFNGVTHIYLMSDGEPNKGIEDFGDLRRFIKEKNKNHVRIITLALGLGEDFPGKRLLEDIAKDNSGSYDYKNLASQKSKDKN